MSRRLLPRPTVADRGVVALVAALGTLLVVGTAVASGWLRTTADEMAAATFAAAPYSARQVHVVYAEVRDGGIPADAADALADAVAPDLATLLRRPRHSVSTTEAVMEPLPKAPQYSPSSLALVAVADARDHLRIVEGRYPRPGTTEVRLPRRLTVGYDGPRRVPVLEVALERSAARAMDVAVGDYLDLVPRRYSPDAPARPALPQIAGLFEATTPYPSPLDDVANLRRPAISDLPELTVVRAAALTADEETLLQAPLATPPEVRWTFDPARLPDAREAAAVVDDARLLAVQPWPDLLTSSASTGMTGLGDLGSRFVDQRRASDTLAVLVLAALASAGLGLLLAAAAVLESRRREVVDVLRARGAGTGRLALLRGGEALLLLVPGVAVVAALLAAGRLTAGDVGLGLVAAGVAVVLLTAAQVTPWRRMPERLRVPARDALQIVTVLLAGGLGVALLSRDRLDATDPLLLLLPALVGAAGAVLVVRGVRVTTAVVRRVAARGRRLTPLVGTSQAAATAEHVTLPVAALVLGLGSALLATGVADTLHRGADRAAWDDLGADVRISEARLGAPDLDRLREVPGVEAVAPVYSVEALLHTLTGRQPVRVMGVDPASLAEVTGRGGDPVRVPGTDEASGPGATPGSEAETGAGALPVLASADLELEETTMLEYAQADVPVRVTGRPARVPGLTDGEPFVLVDITDLRAAVSRSLLRAQTVLVAGSPDDAEVRAVVREAWPTAVVESRSAAAGELLDQPVASRTLAVARVSVVGSALVAVLAAALAVALGGPLRRRTRAVLQALGTDPRQARWVSAVELLPAMLAATLAAVAGALLLMAVLGRGASLDVLTGVQNAAWLLPGGMSWLLAGVLLAGGLAALVLAARVDPRLPPGSTTDEGGAR